MRRQTLRLASILGLSIVLGLIGCSGGQEPAPAASSDAADGQWSLDWADGSVSYEIFVRSFADSDGDGIGDLQGLISRLDYLNDGNSATDSDLGIECLWLMPVFASPSYHGYDTTDYYSVNPDYGTNQDLDELLAAAHARGVRVILDLMINHTGSDHPWFVESASSKTNPKRDWYVWRDDDPGWTQPWSDDGWPTWHESETGYYYGIFWGGMPDLNLANPEVRAEILKIADFWLDRGVDGFRLDAARHLFANGDGQLQNDQPETHAFWRDLATHVRETHPGALLVGENWTDSEHIAPYYGATAEVTRGDELPMNFDFPVAQAILDAVRSRSGAPVIEAVEAQAQLYPPGVLAGTFLTNHDMPRIATVLDRDPVRLRSAAAILLTLPGSPFIYYGEEIGMVGDKPDEDIRTPMQWSSASGADFTTGQPWHDLNPDYQSVNVATQDTDPESLLSFYRRLIHLRNAFPAVHDGDIDILAPVAGQDAVLAYALHAAGSDVLVVHNLGSTMTMAGPWPLELGVGELLLGGDAGVSTASGDEGVALILPAGASAVVRLE
jgi:glycosidase